MLVGMHACTHSPATSAARFQMAQGPILGYGPGVWDPLLYSAYTFVSEAQTGCDICFTYLPETIYSSEIA